MVETISAVANSPLAFVLALAMLMLLELPISAILHALGQDDEIPPPRGANREIWRQISNVQRPRGGVWIGRVERLLFFISIPFASAITVGWLGFKVASKWETWTNLYKVPDTIRGINQLDFLRARMDLGSRTYQRFLVGTSANLIASLISLGLFFLLAEAFPCL